MTTTNTEVLGLIEQLVCLGIKIPEPKPVGDDYAYTIDPTNMPPRAQRLVEDFFRNLKPNVGHGS